MDNYQALRTRYISVKFILDEGVFPASITRDNRPSNVKIIHSSSDNHSLTVDAKINKMAGQELDNATVTITGIATDDIKLLLKTNQYQGEIGMARNTIEIYAGYELGSDGFPPLIYTGRIFSALPDYNAESRSRPFTIVSYKLVGANLDSGITNLKGQIALDDLYQSIANELALNVTYSAVGTAGQYATNPNYTGTASERLNQACADYGFEWKFTDNFVLITKEGQPYDQQVVEISPKNNLLGYVMYLTMGVSARVRYSPQIRFGQIVNLKTEDEFVNGNRWYINGLTHHLCNRSPEFVSTLILNVFSQYGTVA